MREQLKLAARQIEASGTAYRTLWFDEAREFYVPESGRQTWNFLIDTVDATAMVSDVEYATLDEAAREGFATSEVYNNAGLCYRELGRFDQGADSLERALEIDQKLAAAHYNLVDLEWQRALNEERVPDVTALKDALKKLGGYNGEFYLLSALTRGVRYTFSDDDLDPMNYRLGQTCSHAVREGIDPKFLDRVAELYPPVKQDGSFQRAREGLRQHKIVERAERLLHPLPSI